MTTGRAIMALVIGLALSSIAAGARSVSASPAAAQSKIQRNSKLCEAAMSAASACGAEDKCTEDTPVQLSSADRGAVVALKRARGFSVPAFNRYCLNACTAHSPAIDVDAFSREVCGLDTNDEPVERKREERR